MSSQTLTPILCGSCGAQLAVPGDTTYLVCAFCQTKHEVAQAGGILALRPIQESLLAVQGSVERMEAHAAHIDDATTIAALRIQLDALNIDLKAALAARNTATVASAVALGVVGVIVAQATGFWIGLVLGAFAGSRTQSKKIADLQSRVNENEQRIRRFQG